MEYYGNNDYRDYLSHHGILGQKWGVRRFQAYGSGGYDRKGGKTGKVIGDAKTSRGPGLTKDQLKQIDALGKTKHPPKKERKHTMPVTYTNGEKGVLYGEAFGTMGSGKTKKEAKANYEKRASEQRDKEIRRMFGGKDATDVMLRDLDIAKAHYTTKEINDYVQRHPEERKRIDRGIKALAEYNEVVERARNR
jgi:hypothetical protein